MPHIWDKRDIEGYLLILDAFLEHEIGAEAYSQAAVALWSADRDLKEGVAADQRRKKGEALLGGMILGQLAAREFGEAWAGIWACGYRRLRPQSHILSLLHHWAYAYTPDQELQREQPTVYIDEIRLWDVSMALRAVLKCLTEEEWT